MAKAPAFYAIPAGATSVPCRGSDCRKPVFWGKTHAGRPIPLSTEVEGGIIPTQFEAGRGVSHHSNCPNANDFRAAKRRGR